MSDTIDLLEAIGRDAALRYASADELAPTLAQADASPALKAAVTFGDSARLSEEFGYRAMGVDHTTQTPGYEEDDTDEDAEDDDSPAKPVEPKRQKP